MDKITDNLYIADMDDVEEKELGNYIDFHVNLAKKYLGVEDLYYPLPDRKMDDQRRFNGAVYNVAEQLQKKKSVCVNCYVGVSRSVAVSATALAYVNDSNWVKEFQRIKDKRPIANPKPALRRHGKKFLGEDNVY